MSRFLGVSPRLTVGNLERTFAFYRDILDFAHMAAGGRLLQPPANIRSLKWIKAVARVIGQVLSRYPSHKRHLAGLPVPMRECDLMSGSPEVGA